MVPTYRCVKILCTQLCNVLHVHVFMFIPAFISLTPKHDDLIADATISLVPSSKQTWHCTNTCQSVIVLFTSVSHVWVCLHRAQVQSPALREQKRPARSAVTPSHPHSMHGAVGTGRPQTRSDENTAPVKPAASRNAVATAQPGAASSAWCLYCLACHAWPGQKSRFATTLHLGSVKTQPKIARILMTRRRAYCMYCLHLSCPHLLFLHSEVVKGYEFG